MKITADAKALADALKIVNSVVDARNVKPILRDVLVEAVGDYARLAATDLEVSGVAIIRDATVGEPGALVVPGDILGGIAGEASGVLSIEAGKQNALAVKTPDSAYTVQGVHAEEFPATPSAADLLMVVVAGDCLADALKQAVKWVANERSRYSINAVLLEISGGKLTVAATDGRRLCVMPVGEAKAEDGRNRPADVTALLPVKAAKILAGLKLPDAVGIHIQERSATVSADGTVLSAQLIEGRFPPYAEVIPADDGETVLRVPVAALKHALYAAAVMCTSEVRATTFAGKRGKLALTASSAEHGEGESACECDITGEPLADMKLNPDYVDDALALCGEDAEIHFYGHGKGVKFKSGERVGIIMPITED